LHYLDPNIGVFVLVIERVEKEELAMTLTIATGTNVRRYPTTGYVITTVALLPATTVIRQQLFSVIYFVRVRIAVNTLVECLNCLLQPLRTEEVRYG
jgi:hypothetical protein